MEYRTLGRTGERVSAIGLGTEYLIDLPPEHVARVIGAALDAGVNYYDLFFAQPHFRDAMGAAFAGRRQEAMLVAHLGAAVKDGQYQRTRNVRTSERYFHDFLERYHTDYVDVLMLHNIDGQRDYDKVMSPGGLLEMAQRFRQEGKARYIGFSGHTVETSLQAVQSGQIDVLMFPINLVGNAVPGKRDLFAACVREGVGLVAMKPYAGGRLLRPDTNVSAETFQVGGGRVSFERRLPVTAVQCLHYVLSQPGVSTIVPGCKDLEQLAAAQAYWSATEEERDFAAALADYQRYEAGQCVYCNHCLPCPAHIDIGQTIRLLDEALAGSTDSARAAYAELPGGRAADCTRCGACEERCPFGVGTMALIAQAAQVLA